VKRDEQGQAPQTRLAQSDAVLLDWDGCIATDGKPDPLALELMAQWSGRVAIVSNNSTHLPEDFCAILARRGLVLPPGRVILAGIEALKRAQEMGARRVMLIGHGRMKALGRNLGLNIVQEGADLVVLLRDPRFSYARLERAANCLKAGARLIVANPDLTHPGCGGRIVPETGALLAALTACVGVGTFEMEVVGKPGPRLFDSACRTLRVEPARAVMIGDNPATDIAGAQAFGLASILIGATSGISFEDLLARDPAPRSWAAQR
jgi:HAD superfamily hydrolase (TIGR01450 family)